MTLSHGGLMQFDDATRDVYLQSTLFLCLSPKRGLPVSLFGIGSGKEEIHATAMEY